MKSNFYATTTPLEVFLHIAQELYPNCGEIEVALGKNLPEGSTQGIYVAEKGDKCKIGISHEVYCTEKDIFEVAIKMVCTRIARVLYPESCEDAIMCSIHTALIIKSVMDEIDKR